MEITYNLFQKKDPNSSPFGANDPMLSDLEFIASIQAPNIGTALGIANSDTFVSSPRTLVFKGDNRRTEPGDVLESNGVFWVVTPDGFRELEGWKISNNAPSMKNREYYGQLFQKYGGILATIEGIRSGHIKPSTVEPEPVSKPVYPGRTAIENVLLNF